VKHVGQEQTPGLRGATAEQAFTAAAGGVMNNSSAVCRAQGACSMDFMALWQASSIPALLPACTHTVTTTVFEVTFAELWQQHCRQQPLLMNCLD
jgi:hypothetical protein